MDRLQLALVFKDEYLSMFDNDRITTSTSDR
jgi:hypothetical protein